MFNSKSCYGKVSGKPLKSYESESEAKEAIKYVKKTYSNEQIQYECSECGYWHLSGIDRRTPNHLSDCIDSSGKPKHAYYSKEDAEKRALIIYEEQGILLKVYKCVDCELWHLTHL